MKTKGEEVKVKKVENRVFVETETPSLISFNEFIASIRKKCLIETIGGFSYSMRKSGTPQKLPLSVWKAKFDAYLTRKV